MRVVSHGPLMFPNQRSRTPHAFPTPTRSMLVMCLVDVRIPQPTVTHTPATLTLADFTLPAGLTTPDVLALFTAEAPTDVYRDSNRGGYADT